MRLGHEHRASRREDAREDDLCHGLLIELNPRRQGEEISNHLTQE